MTDRADGASGSFDVDRRHVRTVYRWIDGEDTTITFDLVLSGDRVVERTVFFGFTGQMPSSFFPFALLADGRIDFGSDYADDEVRFIRTDIRDRPVRLGELMSTQEKGDDGRVTAWSYRCVRVDPV